MTFKPRNRLQGQFLQDCRLHSADELIDKWILRETPYAFRLLAAQFLTWRLALAQCLGVQPGTIVVVGSTAAGLSLSPYKNLRMHGPTSDLDVAVISSNHFNLAWDWFVTQKQQRLRYPVPVNSWIEEHKQRLIFYRQIGCDRYLEYLPFGPQWVQCLEQASVRDPVNQRVVKIRIYADDQSLRSYLQLGIQELKAALGL
jgi:hypothetical protein